MEYKNIEDSIVNTVEKKGFGWFVDQNDNCTSKAFWFF